MKGFQCIIMRFLDTGRTGVHRVKKVVVVITYLGTKHGGLQRIRGQGNL